MNTSELDLEDELLSAYLDGELSTTEAVSIENRLVREERLRLRLAELRRANELLDVLPETPHDQRFTRSTLELVVQELNDGTKSFVTNKSVHRSSMSWWDWPRFGFLLSGLLVVGICIGMGIRAIAISREIQELGLAASMPGLSDVSELSIAESLLKEKTALDVLRMHYKEDLVPSIPASLGERKTWILGMTPNQLDKVNSGRDMLRKLRPETYKRLAAIESKIESLAEGNELQECIRLVGLVLDNLPSYKREDLNASPDKRLQFLREQLRYSAALAYSHHIPESDEKAVETWYDEVLRNELGGRDPDFYFARAFREDNTFVLDRHVELVSALLPSLTETARSLIENLGNVDQMSAILIWKIRDNDREMQFIEYYERLPREERERYDLRDPDNRGRGRFRR